MTRILKFKAWNTETKLLMKLNSIDCEKGVLIKKDHILLQFTGLHDKNGSELYEKDVLLFSMDKMMIQWNESEFRWDIINEKGITSLPFTPQELVKGTRLCNYYESPDSFKL